MSTYTVKATHDGKLVDLLVYDLPMQYWACIKGSNLIFGTQQNIESGTEISKLEQCDLLICIDTVNNENQLERYVDNYIACE